MYKPRKKRQYITYLKAETYQKNFANFCNVVLQNLATMSAKFDKNFRNFCGVYLALAESFGQTLFSSILLLLFLLADRAYSKDFLIIHTWRARERKRIMGSEVEPPAGVQGQSRRFFVFKTVIFMDLLQFCMK